MKIYLTEELNWHNVYCNMTWSPLETHISYSLIIKQGHPLLVHSCPKTLSLPYAFLQLTTYKLKCCQTNKWEKNIISGCAWNLNIVFILSLLPLPAVHPTPKTTSQWASPLYLCLTVSLWLGSDVHREISTSLNHHQNEKGVPGLMQCRYVVFCVGIWEKEFMWGARWVRIHFLLELLPCSQM